MHTVTHLIHLGAPSSCSLGPHPLGDDRTLLDNCLSSRCQASLKESPPPSSYGPLGILVGRVINHWPTSLELSAHQVVRRVLNYTQDTIHRGCPLDVAASPVTRFEHLQRGGSEDVVGDGFGLGHASRWRLLEGHLCRVLLHQRCYWLTFLLFLSDRLQRGGDAGTIVETVLQMAPQTENESLGRCNAIPPRHTFFTPPESDSVLKAPLRSMAQKITELESISRQLIRDIADSCSDIRQTVLSLP